MENWKSALYERYVSTGQAQLIPHGPQPYLLRMIARHMPADRRARIADLGCGHGTLVQCLRDSGYADVIGVDVSSEQVEAARQRGIEGIVQGDLQRFLEAHPASFDAVVLMDVLEHLTKPEIIDMLRAARAALRSGGRLIVHAPNGAGLHGMRIMYGDFTHETCLTPQSASQILLATGFEDIGVHEDVPTLHNLKGVIRFVLWHVMTLPRRLLLFAETGILRHVLSQNLLVVARVR